MKTYHVVFQDEAGVGSCTVRDKVPLNTVKGIKKIRETIKNVGVAKGSTVILNCIELDEDVAPDKVKAECERWKNRAIRAEADCDEARRCATNLAAKVRALEQCVYGICEICVHKEKRMINENSPCYEYYLSGLMTGIYTRCEHWEFAVTGDGCEKEVDTQ